MKPVTTFSLNVLGKITTFFDTFQKDPNQNVEKICDKLKLTKSTLYAFCRQNNIVIAEIREGKDLGEKINHILKTNRERKGALATTDTKMPDIKYTGRGGNRTEPLSVDVMEAVVAKVDDLRKQGYNVEDAMKKTKINLHFSTYYAYKRKLKKSGIKPEIKNETIPELVMPDIKKPKRTYNTRPKKDVPTVPHSIEYIHTEKRKNPKQEIIMMIGNAEALIEFLKMKGNQDDD